MLVYALMLDCSEDRCDDVAEAIYSTPERAIEARARKDNPDEYTVMVFELDKDRAMGRLNLTNSPPASS